MDPFNSPVYIPLKCLWFSRARILSWGTGAEKEACREPPVLAMCRLGSATGKGEWDRSARG